MNESALARRAEIARRVALGSYAALVLVLSVEVFGIVRLELATRAVLWVFWIGMLLVLLPGMLRGAWKTYLWLCFVVLVYFMVTVSELFAANADPGDWIELVLEVILFNAAMLHARWRQRQLAADDN